jgi:hypothetical protein
VGFAIPNIARPSSLGKYRNKKLFMENFVTTYIEDIANTSNNGTK